MILDALILENFGVYAGSQEVDLKPAKGKPVILFGGLNGGGKTTLLDALQLVFYGRKARTSNRGRLPYHEYLEKTIHRGVDRANSACVGLRFRRMVEGKECRFLVARRWKKTPKGVEEDLDVYRDGEIDPEASENWGEYIEGFLPNGIAHLFFFDAEQIADLAEGDNAREMLRTGIHSLLGLDLIDRLEGDLKVLERKKRAEIPASKAGRAVEAAEEDVLRLDRESDEVSRKLAESRTELASVHKEVSRYQREFQRAGGNLFERRQELVHKLQDIEGRIAAEEEALRHLVEGPAPLLIIENLLKEIQDQVSHDTAVLRAGQLSGELELRDNALLGKLAKQGAESEWHAKLEKLMDADRKKRNALASEVIVLGADEQLHSELKHLLHSTLPKNASEIERHLERLEKLHFQHEGVLKDVVKIPPEEAVAEIHKSLAGAQQKEGRLRGKIQAEEGRLNFLLGQLKSADGRAKELGREVASAEIGDEDRGRILRHSQKARDTLEQFRAAVTRKHVHRIEALMLESFTQLLRKERLVKDLTIDPDTFDVRLTGRDGEDLAFDRLSAGERQLLATSLLWGLARASGRPIPTVIDTPLGRLDSSHRRHMVERYFPVAAHQVILLSTDEEINSLNLKRLEKSVAKTYQLRHDDATGGTVIEPGYFPAYETAS